MSTQLRRYAAELVGTLILLFVGGLSVISATAVAVDQLISISFGFGLAMLIALYTMGDVAQGFFNPAASLGAWLDGRIKLSDMIGYWISQVAGAGLGGLLLFWVSSQEVVRGTRTAPAAGTGEAFLIELVLSACFVMVILKVTKSDRFGGHAPLAISLALVGIHLAAVPLSGASVNPARSLGSAFVGGDMSHIWIYLVAPLLGAVVGWALYQLTTSGTVNVAVETD